MKKITGALLLMLIMQTNLSKAQSENAISFDNFDDFIIAPAASSLITGGSEISMTFWVLASNTAPTYPDYDGFAGFRNNSDADFYILQLTANGLEARFRNSNGVNYDVTFGGFQTGTPQHLALTYDGATLALYHNGALAGSAPASGNITNSFENFYMGMLPWTGANFYTNGRLDEVSLWNKALTSSEINCIYEGAINPNENGLLLYYKCNQGISGGNNTSVTNLADAKGNINGVFNNLALTGNLSNFVNGVLTTGSATLTDSVCPGTPYVLGNQTLTAPGTYYESFPTTGGCDSIVTLYLFHSASNIDTSVVQMGNVLTAQQSGAFYQWLDCNNFNIGIPGATGQSFTAPANGTYAVTIITPNCIDTSSCIPVNGVGIHDLNNLNPQVQISSIFTDEIIINNQSSKTSFDFTLTDMSGKLLIKDHAAAGEIKRIPSAAWTSGFYLLSANNGEFRKKMIKYLYNH